MAANHGNAVCNYYFFKLYAVRKGILCNSCRSADSYLLKRLWNGNHISIIVGSTENVSEVGIAAFIRSVAYKGQGYAFKRVASGKCISRYARNGFGNDYLGEIVASLKGILCNRHNVERNLNRCLGLSGSILEERVTVFTNQIKISVYRFIAAVIAVNRYANKARAVSEHMGSAIRDITDKGHSLNIFASVEGFAVNIYTVLLRRYGHALKRLGNEIAVLISDIGTENVSEVGIAASIRSVAYKGQRYALKSTTILKSTLADRLNVLRDLYFLKSRTALKCRLANTADNIGEFYAFKRGAALKGVFANGCSFTCDVVEAIHLYAHKTYTVLEGSFSDRFNSLGEFQASKRGATLKGISSNSLETGIHHYPLKLYAILECVCTNALNASGKSYFLQRRAALECKLLYACRNIAFCYYYSLKLSTVFKCRSTDNRDVFGYLYFRKCAAILKRRRANALNAVGDRYAFKCSTALKYGVLNLSQALRKFNYLQCFTVTERHRLKSLNTRKHGNASKMSTIIECGFANVLNAVGDSHISRKTASGECTGIDGLKIFRQGYAVNASLQHVIRIIFGQRDIFKLYTALESILANLGNVIVEIYGVQLYTVVELTHTYLGNVIGNYDLGKT